VENLPPVTDKFSRTLARQVSSLCNYCYQQITGAKGAGFPYSLEMQCSGLLTPKIGDKCVETSSNSSRTDEALITGGAEVGPQGDEKAGFANVLPAAMV
jgi:hypothetical protein